MRRRRFMVLLGGAATAWPLAVRAQQPEGMRRVGVLMNQAANDPEGQARVAAFLQGLEQLGWTKGHNVRIEYRWSAGNDADNRKNALELVALAPDVIFASVPRRWGMRCKRAARTDRVRSRRRSGRTGFVDSLARPGGNVTGFAAAEYGMSVKWPENQGDRAGCDAGGRLRIPLKPSGRSVRRNPDRGAFVQGGGEPDQRARCARDRARRHGLRALWEGRADRDNERVGGIPSRPYHHARGPA